MCVHCGLGGSVTWGFGRRYTVRGMAYCMRGGGGGGAGSWSQLSAAIPLSLLGCWSVLQGPGSLAEKRVFDQFSCTFGPFSRLCWVFWRAKTGHHRLKTAQKDLCGHPKWFGNNFGKTHFLSLRGPPVDPFWPWPLGLHVAGSTWPSVRRYGGAGGRLGNSEGWTPQKVGHYGWTM